MAQWAVFQNRIIVTFPVVQSPMGCEIVITPMVQAVSSGYNGQLSVVCWPSKGYLTLDLTFPPLVQSDAESFVSFFASCEGQQACFTLPSPIAAVIPAGYGTSGYYQLAENTSKYSYNVGLIGGVQMKVREVLSSA